MNVETLRRHYYGLTPFERAAMLMQEAVGKKREAEVDALAPRDLWGSFWLSHWNDTFYTVASLAMFRSAYCGRLAGLVRACQRDGENSTAKAWELELIAVGWIRALRRLAEKTGAPLLDACKILDEHYAGDMLEIMKEHEVDDSKQYESLLEIWRIQTSQVNTSDKHHADMA